MGITKDSDPLAVWKRFYYESLLITNSHTLSEDLASSSYLIWLERGQPDSSMLKWLVIDAIRALLGRRDKNKTSRRSAGHARTSSYDEIVDKNPWHDGPGSSVDDPLAHIELKRIIEMMPEVLTDIECETLMDCAGVKVRDGAQAYSSKYQKQKAWSRIGVRKTTARGRLCAAIGREYSP